jgi:phosphonate transport system substrate-binding protein
MRRWLVLALAAILALGVLGLAQPGSSPDEPIYMLLVPSTEGATVEEVGQQIAQALFELTGLYIVPSLQADYTAMIEAFAASEGDTFGMPTTDQYIRIYERTNGNVSPRLGSVRYGYPWYYSSVYARRDSGIRTLEDLNGKVWIYNDTGSTSGYVIPNMLFEKEGIELSGIVTTGGHTNSMVALIEGQGDFCTGYGSAPGAPAAWSGDRWNFGDDPELWLWDRWNNDLFREELRGTCYDLRRAVRKTYDFDTVLREIGVVMNIGPIPNDCLAFGPDFPKDVADRIVEAVKTHIATDEGKALWGDENFYEWTAVADIDDSFYDGYRDLLGLPIPER